MKQINNGGGKTIVTPVLTARESAQYCGKSEGAFVEWARVNHIPFIPDGKNRTKRSYRASVLDKYLKQSETIDE